MSKNKFHSASGRSCRWNIFFWIFWMKKTEYWKKINVNIDENAFHWYSHLNLRVDIQFIGSVVKTWWRKRFIWTFAIADTANQRLSTSAQGQLMFISFNNIFFSACIHDIMKYFEITNYIYIILFEFDLFFSQSGTKIFATVKHLCGGCSEFIENVYNLVCKSVQMQQIE